MEYCYQLVLFVVVIHIEQNWTAEMSARDQKLKSSAKTNNDYIPDVRGQGLTVKSSKHKSSNKTKDNAGGVKNPMPRSHRDWDKFVFAKIGILT